MALCVDIDRSNAQTKGTLDMLRWRLLGADAAADGGAAGGGQHGAEGAGSPAHAAWGD